MFFLGLAVEILDAAGQAFSSRQYPGDNSIGPQFETARLEGYWDQMIGRVEKGSGVTSATTGAAVMTGGKSVVRASQNSTATGNDRNAYALCSFLQEHFAAAGARRRHVVSAAGQRVGIVIAATYSDQLVHPIVVWCDVSVRNRPRSFPPVMFRPFEVQVGVAERNPAPHVGLPADSPDPPKVERFVWLSEVWLFLGA